MRVIPLAFVAVFASNASTQVVPIVNGDFEDVTGMVRTSSTVRTGLPVGWSFSGLAAPVLSEQVQVLSYSHGGAPTGGEGSWFLEAHTEAQLGTLSQLVSGLTPGATYQLSFLWGNRRRVDLDSFRFRVQISGQTFAAAGSGLVAMTLQTLQFVANSTTASLEITFLSPGAGVQTNTNGALDDFRLIRLFPDVLASASAYGVGCGFPPMTLLPDPSARPLIGTMARAFLGDVPGAPTVALLGSSNTRFGLLPLPTSLSPFGFTGCDLLQSLDLPTLPVTFVGARSASVELAVPNDPALVSRRVFVQGLAAAPGVNAAGNVLSNGLEWRIGDR